MNDIPNHLVLDQLQVGSVAKAGRTLLLEDIHLAIPRGKTLALVGESGSGKSLTALSIVQLLPVNIAYGQGSQIHLNDISILELSERSMQKLRGRKIGFIFQEPMTALNPVLTIEQQLIEVLHCHQLQAGRSKKVLIAELATLLASLDITDPQRCLNSYPHQLSGGMKQRAMIAMALVGEPELLIADEPTTAVDLQVQAQILALLKQIQQERGLSLLFITHDLGVVKQIADEVAVIYQGKVIEHAETKAFFASPQHPYSQRLFAALPSYAKRQSELLEVNSLIKKNEIILDKSPLLKVQDASVYFSVKKALLAKNRVVLKAVDAVNFTLYRGETLAIVGESGSGKTTLAKALIGLIPLTQGQIEKNTSRIQMIFQDPYSSLNPKMLIGDILAEGLRAQGVKIKDATIYPPILKVLDQVGIVKSSVERYPHEFSGGQRQRIAIARALLLSPDILICDEPTSALDLSVQAQVLNLLQNLQQELGLSYLFITHNLSVVSYLADRVLVMRRGNIIEEGEIEQILFAPRDEYTRNLFALGQMG